MSGTNSAEVPNKAVISLQREVQRKFGRNLLVLQQYERLVKGLVAEQDVAGPINELHSIRARQIEAVSKKTLGQVVGDLTGNFITPTLGQSDTEPSDEPPVDPTQPWFRVIFRIAMAESDYLQTQQKLANLVDLRNDQVHHFLEKYDIWSEAGCLAADAYLDDCFKQIDTHFQELRGWAQHNLDSRERMGSLMRTQEFRDFLVHGIFPGGAGISWSSCTIVNLLRDAEAALAKDGWTFLKHAIDYIRTQNAEHTPKRYGCSSWRHVLHESGQFVIRKEQPDSGLPTETWYRSRP